MNNYDDAPFGDASSNPLKKDVLPLGGSLFDNTIIVKVDILLARISFLSHSFLNILKKGWEM